MIAYLQRGIDKGRDGYTAVVRPLARRALISGVLVVAFALATGWLAKIVPSGFLPEEDQGAFFAEIQLPDAASLNRTNTVVTQVESMIQDRPWTQSVLTVAGYSLIDGLALPNKAIAVIGLKPFDERTDPSLSVFSALAELNPLFRQIAAANVVAFNLPPIAGLGNSAGFELQLQTLAGAPPRDLAAVADGLVIAANQNPALAGVFTTYGASTPQVYLKLDRERAETLGVVDRRYLQRAADDDGRHLRQRLQPLRPHLAGQGPGRCQPTAKGSKTFSACGCAPRRAISFHCAPSPMSELITAPGIDHSLQ